MFDGKVALITGAARGIGQATAEILSAGGASVVIADLDPDAAQETAAALPGETEVWTGNLELPQSADQVVEAAVSAFGKIDIVVNGAGYTLDGPIHKMSDADFQTMLEIHAAVPFRILRAAAPYLREPAKRERAEGREVFRKVVNISSLAAFGNAGQTNYSTAKSAILGLTKTLAKEWGGLRINVNAAAFGFIETRLTQPRGPESHIDIAGRQIGIGVPETTLAALETFVPLGRAGTAREAAGGVAFLCSPWSDYVTGQVLNVSGGAFVGMGPT